MSPRSCAIAGLRLRRTASGRREDPIGHVVVEPMFTDEGGLPFTMWPGNQLIGNGLLLAKLDGRSIENALQPVPVCPMVHLPKEELQC